MQYSWNRHYFLQITKKRTVCSQTKKDSPLVRLFALAFFTKCAWFSVDAHTHFTSRFQIPVPLGTILYSLIRTYVPTCSSWRSRRWRRWGRRGQSFGDTRRGGRHASSLVGASTTIWWVRVVLSSLAIRSSSHLHIFSTTTTVLSRVDFLAALGGASYGIFHSRHFFLYIMTNKKTDLEQDDRRCESTLTIHGRHTNVPHLPCEESGLLISFFNC